MSCAAHPDTPPNPRPRKRSPRRLIEHIWRLDYASLSRARKAFYRILQILLLVAEKFINNRLLLQAGALTYSSMLSVVPLLAFVFALLKGLGVPSRLEPFILERVTAGSQEVVARLAAYVDKVSAGSLGSIGLLLLLLSVILVLNSVENAFNDIWGVTSQRVWHRKFADYLSILVVAPFLLLLALSATAGLKSITLIYWVRAQPGLGPMVVFLLRLVPYLAIWSVMVFVFIFMPNTRVRFRPALIAGVLTGTLWQLVQWAYVTFQVGVPRYHAIYGTFAQIPIMLVWMFISWTIVLFGAEFTYALQNVEAYRRERRSSTLQAYHHTELNLAFLRDVLTRFQQGGELWTAEALAQAHEIPVRVARQLLGELTRAGYLGRTILDRAVAYAPARALGGLPIAEILETLETSEAGNRENETHDASAPRDSPALRARERALLKQVWQARRQALAGLTLDTFNSDSPKKNCD